MSHHKKQPRNQSSRPRRVHFIGLIVFIFLVGGGILFLNADRSNSNTVSTPDQSEDNGFDTTQHSIDDSASLWIVVNKQRPLAPGYSPEELVNPSIPLYGPRDAENMLVDARITDDLEELVTDAQSQGLELALGSGYRSESYQRGIYNTYVERDGQEASDRFSARPRHSEHQTGLAVDFVLPSGECAFEACFADTPEGEWLIENSHRYGFILRYPQEAEPRVGYQYEPWHFRYVGRPLAQEIHGQNSPTLEEFFDLPPAPDYSQD